MSKEFVILLYQLSQKLQKDEIDAIRFMEQLPADLEGKSGLHVFVKLQMLGKITDTDPSTLQGVFKNINRMDLVNKVKEFVKSQKASQRKSKTITNPNCDELLFGLKANLEVSLVQAKLLCDQLRNLASAAEKSGIKSIQHTTVESIGFVENEVQRRLLRVKEEMVKKERSSPESSDDDQIPSGTLQQGSDNKLTTASITQGWNKSPIIPLVQEVPKYPTQEEADKDDNHYEEVPIRPHAIAVPMHLYCTLLSADLPTRSSSTRVKMNGTHQTRTLDKDCHTRDMSKPMPAPKPMHMTSQLRSQRTQREVKDHLDSGAEDCSFSGGTYSCSDSGFFDVSRYLMKRPVAAPRSASLAHTKPSPVVASKPPPVPTPRLPSKPHKYTAINTEQVQVSYYKSPSREDNIFQKLMNGQDVESTKGTCEHYTKKFT